MLRFGQGTLLLMVFGTVLGVAHAETAKSPLKAGPVVAHFHDGTTVRQAYLPETIELESRYGKLTVPVAEIRRIEFGFHLSDEAAQQVDKAIEQLGSNNFQEREAAGKRLVALGFRAFRALQTAAKSKDMEVARRAETAISQIREKVPAEQLRLKPQDVIYTRDSVLAGQILSQTLKARTDNFGELQFKVADLQSIRSMATQDAEMTADIAHFDRDPRQWQDSGVDVDDDCGLVVTASGKVDLVPKDQPGQHVCGPEGYAPGGQVFGFQIGTLLGRIGETGHPFPIGKRYEGRIPRGGRLYLYVIPVQESGAKGSTGSYQVNVSTGPELAVGKRGNASPAGPSPYLTPPTGTLPGVPVAPVAPMAPPPPPMAPPPANAPRGDVNWAPAPPFIFTTRR